MFKTLEFKKLDIVSCLGFSMTTNGLTCKILEKRGKRAKIEVEGQIFEIPTEILPIKSQEGVELKLFFLNSDQANLQEKRLAKLLLEEILNGK